MVRLHPGELWSPEPGGDLLRARAATHGRESRRRTDQTGWVTLGTRSPRQTPGPLRPIDRIPVSEKRWRGAIAGSNMAVMPIPTTYDDLLARVRGLIEATDRVPVVGISGHGGSGKSTLAARLGADLGLEPGQVVGTDAFYATTCGPDAGEWEQHDWPLIKALVEGARAEPRPRRMRFDYRWWTGETGVEVQPMPPVLIVEGTRLISDRTRDWFDLMVWIDLDPDAAGARAKERNRLQGDDRAELDLWDTKWIPEGHAYEQAERPLDHADVVVTAGR